MTSVVDFDAARHRYTVNGEEQLSVTRVLTDCGLIEARWYTEDAAIRGSYVHAALALLHEDDLDVASLDAAAVPFVEAYQLFQRDSGFEHEAWEYRVCNPSLRCAGTLDLLGKLPSSPTRSACDLIDIKTGAVPSWVGYQTAGYAELFGKLMVRRWCLQLSDDGTYRLHPLTNRRDRDVFLAALTVAQAKRGWL